jgi:hypothetical protein
LTTPDFFAVRAFDLPLVEAAPFLAEPFFAAVFVVLLAAAALVAVFFPPAAFVAPVFAEPFARPASREAPRAEAFDAVVVFAADFFPPAFVFVSSRLSADLFDAFPEFPPAREVAPPLFGVFAAMVAFLLYCSRPTPRPR